MALPPKGDPTRPMYLAIRSMRLLGIIIVLFSLLMFIPVIALRGSGGAGIGFSILFIIMALVYLIPGLLFILCSIFLKRRQAWAIIVGIILSSIVLLMSIFGLIAGLFQMVTGNSEPFMLVQLIISLIFVAAFAQLIFHLSKSFESLRVLNMSVQRGFEPLPVASIAPPISPGPPIQS
jgi:hypothetical protein